MPAHRARDEFNGVRGTRSASVHSSVPHLSRKFVARRISEGETGRLKEELKCQACGKGYKHVSSLAKHLWEHTPEWNVTSKLLISKHQQVQLLEAASILVSMNEQNDSEDDDELEPVFSEAKSAPINRSSLLDSMTTDVDGSSGSNSAVTSKYSSPESTHSTEIREKQAKGQRTRRISSNVGASPGPGSMLSMRAGAPPSADKRNETALYDENEDGLQDPPVFGEME